MGNPRSGKHTTPRRKLREPVGGWSRQDQAAAEAGENWAEWAARKLAEAAEEDLAAD